MLKWVGRILYIFFVLLIIGFVEIISGGIKGIQRSEYVREHILDAYDKDEDVDVFDYLAHYTAAINTYYSSDPLLSKDNQTNYNNLNDDIDNKYKVSISFYPFVSLIKDNKLNLWYDGFHVVFNSYSDKVVYFKIEITSAYNTLDTEEEHKITLTEEEFLNVYLDSDGFFLNQRVPSTTYFINSMFYTEEQQELYDGFEFNVKAIDIYAYIEPLEDEEFDEDGVLIYRLTDGEIDNLSGNPLSINENLNLNSNDYNISKQLEGNKPTEDEIESYNLVNLYHPANFSKYNHIYYIVYGIYFVVIVVLPYFIFFHKKVMARYRKKKPKDDDNLLDNKEKPAEEQIFSDYEPPKDDKK